MPISEVAEAERSSSLHPSAGHPEGSHPARAALDRDTLLVPSVIFLLSRLGLAALAYRAPNMLPQARSNESSLPRTDPLASLWSWSSPWFRFDARWYVDVAQHGYHWGRIAETNTNFFPLYPLLIKVVHPLTLGSYWIAALLVANVSFLASLLFLWSWAREKWSSKVALRIVLFVTTFPFSFFFAAPYAEPVFLALAVAAFMYAERGKWTLAVASASLSAVTRPIGLAVLAALVIVSVRQRKWKRAAMTCTGFIPFLLFVGYLGVTVGHPLGFAVYHTDGWVLSRGGILHTVAIQFNTALSPFDRVDAAMAILFLISAVFVWRRIGLEYALYVALGVALPLSRSLAGMERYVTVLFPAMAVWALTRGRVVHLAIFCLSLLLLVIATAMYATGYALF